MKIFRGAVMAASVLLATSASAQNSYQPPVARIYAAAADTVLAPAATSHATTVAQFLAGRGMPVSAAALIETGGAPALSGLTAVRFEETASGLGLYGVYAKAAFNARGDLVHLIENLVPVSAVAGPAASAAQALAVAVQEHHGAAVALPPQARAQGNTVVFAKTPFFHREPTVTHVAVAGQGALQHGMLVETWSEQGNLLHETLVGPSGEVLFAELRTNYDSYYVFAIDPKQSIQTLVTGNAGWLGAAGQTTVNISGPNVHAYLDANANNAPDSGGTAVNTGEFQAAWDGHQAPGVENNKAVAVQNLFYLNNVMHDVLKTHGFTAGNFEGNDPVNAEAQDGSGTDNANFSTPPDGSSPRMQMYLWSNPAPTLAVVVNGTPYAGKNADFGPQLTTTGISGALAQPSVANGCSKLKAITGKVAVIDRGTCSFKTKVANAQAAGAIGVVIANNDTGSLFVMGDDTAVRTRITIPSVFVGQDDGITLKSKAALAQAATLKDQDLTLLMADASLDSDVVYHEYGHGLTWRMIGGMSGPIAGAIGEGASDGVALLMNDGDVVGEYSAGVPEGIRRHPYSNYPLTYSDVTGAEVHDDGEVFAAIVYDLKDRFTTHGVPIQKLFDYYVDGMNFTPATPMFENMRDGMLESAQGSAADRCLIWRSFAKFGVGVGAKASISRRGAVTIAESFAFPASCQ